MKPVIYFANKAFLLLLIICCAVLTSCKKNQEVFSDTIDPKEVVKRKSGSLPLFTTISEIDAHLKWIARGLAHWEKPHPMVKSIDSITNIPANDSNLNSISYLNSVFAFGGAHEDSINARFSTNNYEEDGLGAFEFDGIIYYTKIYIPNNYYTINKPFVVVAEETPVDSNTNNILTGYIVKPGGGIDSVSISASNEDNYHIWVVDYFTYLEYDEWEFEGMDGLVRKSGVVKKCDNDGNCEPGEQFNPDCTDCHPAPPQKYKLEITEIDIHTDNCPHAERLFGGKYEFSVSYGLYDGSGTPTNTGHVNDFYENRLIKSITAKNICREKCSGSGTKGNNCPSHIHSVNYILYEDIDPSDSSCKMPFIFFERDLDYLASGDEYPSPNYELNPSMGHDVNGFFHPFYHSWQAAYIATTVNIHTLWQANNHNGSFVWVGNNEAKVKIELIKL